MDAHTHLGDAFLRPARGNLPRSIEALVAPPHGVKHRELARADPALVRDAMRKRARAMAAKGTHAALDFREGGTSGLRDLLAATHGIGLDVHALARPASSPDAEGPWREEADHLLQGPTAGLGLSGIRDLPARRLEDAADACRKRGKVLALHLSEARHEPLEEALRYDPRILVHLVHARTSEWDALADARVIAVCCPSSNRFFGMKPPVAAFHRAFQDNGIPTAFGTDNAMLSDGDLRHEAGLAARLLPQGDLDWLLRSLTWEPWRHLGLGPDPADAGLLWGIGAKGPGTHPEETPLSRTAPVWDAKVHAAPPVGP